MESWYQVGALSVGGVLGVNARYWLGVGISRLSGPRFPWATLTINVSGSFAIGLCSVLLARWLPHPQARLLVVAGFLGGYTTFSSFSLESMILWERGELGLCVSYMGVSVGAGFAAVLLGAALGRMLVAPASEHTAAGHGARSGGVDRIATEPGREHGLPAFSPPSGEETEGWRPSPVDTTKTDAESNA